MTTMLGVAACLLSLAAEPAVAADAPAVRQAKPRNSMEIQTARQAWEESGFRLGLGLTYTSLMQRGVPPDGRGFGFILVPSFRLDERWSLSLAVDYTVLSARLSGLYLRATLGLQWQLPYGFLVGVGLGYAGLFADVRDVSNTVASTPETEVTPTVSASNTVAIQDRLLSTCDGLGATASMRVGFVFPVGHLFSTGPVAETLVQRMRCVEASQDIDETTGRAYRNYQFWDGFVWSLAWMLQWR